MTTQRGPHVTVPAAELAKWVEAQPDQWWTVDGDPLLAERVSFPCPGDELAAALRRIGKPLLVGGSRVPPTSDGQEVTAAALSGFALPAAVLFTGVSGDPQAETGDRLLDLTWQGTGIGWLLIEDSESAAAARRDAAGAG